MRKRHSGPQSLLYVVQGQFDDPGGARRFFRRAIRRVSAPVIIDLRRAQAISSTAWGALAAGVHRLTRAGRDVVIFSNSALRGLLELSSVFRYARVVFTVEQAA